MVNIKKPFVLLLKEEETEITEKLGFEETLLKDVILPGRCAGCGACVVVCPFNVLEYSEKPRLIGECKNCGICVRVCPRYDWSLSEVEKFVFGRERRENEEFGIHRKILAAQSTNSKILEVCQDGGVATTLLLCALENGVIDAAIETGIDTEVPLKPKPKVAENLDEIMSCAGTKYVYSPNLLALKEAVEKGKKSLAIVGTPCQIHAIRKIQASPLKKYSNLINITIGLMCTESFQYEGLIEEGLHKKFGINPSEVKKMNIKGKLLIYLKNGEIKEIPLKEVKSYVREGCHHCDDFSNELADISLGGLGLNEWTFTIIRTEKGEEIFREAEKSGFIRVREIEKDSFPMKLLLRLSRNKRKMK